MALTPPGLNNVTKTFMKAADRAGGAALGVPGLLLQRSKNKAAAAKEQAGSKPAGSNGTGAGTVVLKALLGPFLGKFIG